MNSSKYDDRTRRGVKLAQRTPVYRDLQRRAAEERSRLEAALRARNEVIDRLKKRLVQAGLAADEVAQLAA